uniref:Uncharacterized protein n=1 Tax=Pongo abelii TaxID=9601 RepID=A0A8I5TVW3_PONAB
MSSSALTCGSTLEKSGDTWEMKALDSSRLVPWPPRGLGSSTQHPNKPHCALASCQGPGVLPGAASALPELTFQGDVRQSETCQRYLQTAISLDIAVPQINLLGRPSSPPALLIQQHSCEQVIHNSTPQFLVRWTMSSAQELTGHTGEFDHNLGPHMHGMRLHAIVHEAAPSFVWVSAPMLSPQRDLL